MSTRCMILIKCCNLIDRHSTPRGNKFKNAHVHSIAKKRKRRLEILDRKPTLSISNINFRYKKNG